MYSEKKNKVLSLSFKYPEGHSHCSMYVSESFLLHVLISTLLNAHRYPPSSLELYAVSSSSPCLPRCSASPLLRKSVVPCLLPGRALQPGNSK